MEYPKGIFLNPPHEKAPEWILGKISIKVEDAIIWLQEKSNDSGYVNLDICKSNKDNKSYLKLNEWKKEQQTVEPQEEVIIPGEEEFEGF